MREFFWKLMDEENRQADLASFGQIVSLVVAVLFSFLLLIPMSAYAWKTGKIDSNAFWILSLWVGAGLGYGVADKKWGGASVPSPTPPSVPSPPKPEGPSQSSSSPSPKPADPPTHQRTAA